MTDRLLTTQEVAERLTASDDYVRAHAAEFGATRLSANGPLRFRWDRVERALEARRVTADQPQQRRKPGPKRRAPGVELLPLPGERRAA